MQAKFTQYLDENHKRLKDDLVDVFFNDRFIKIEYGKIEEDGERKYGKKFTSAEEAYKVLFERGLVTDMVFVLPLLGVAEFAAFLEIAPSKFSNMYSRQRKGEIVNPPIPKPIQILSATSIWTFEQATEYKEQYDNYTPVRGRPKPDPTPVE
ncbi:hypothetical protein NSQ62_08365 [Solibacillus sp. FSL H8-0523]|uniref:hypothetical protein n=1 Tax=Solibacillus sp. FSL H8-0523 TaxID=2954511 RepID=UPI0031013566